MDSELGGRYTPRKQKKESKRYNRKRDNSAHRNKQLVGEDRGQRRRGKTYVTQGRGPQERFIRIERAKKTSKTPETNCDKKKARTTKSFGTP